MMILVTGYKNSNCLGFTLIELSIVGIIVSILLTLSFPIFNKVYRQAQLKSITRQLASTIRYAHQVAINEQIETKVNYEPYSGRYWVEIIGTAVNNSLLKPRVLPEGIFFKKLTANFLTFYPNGLTENFSIYLTDRNGQIFTIVVDGFTGGIKVFDYEYQ